MPNLDILCLRNNLIIWKVQYWYRLISITSDTEWNALTLGMPEFSYSLCPHKEPFYMFAIYYCNLKSQMCHYAFALIRTVSSQNQHIFNIAQPYIPSSWVIGVTVNHPAHAITNIRLPTFHQPYENSFGSFNM